MTKPIAIGLAVVGVVILILAVVLGWVVVPNVIENKVEDETRLVNGTDIFEKWVDLPVPIYLKFYFFNVTNAEEYLAGTGGDWSAKAKLKEVGPYVYKERRVKHEIKHNDQEGTVSYRQKITFTFVPELSVGPDTDTVSVLNVPLVSVATVLSVTKNLPLPAKAVAQLLLGPMSNERFIKVDVPVKDMIFGFKLNPVYDLVVSVATQMNMTFPPELQHGEFGLYLDKNDTLDEPWEVYTGDKDSSQFAMIKTINGKSSHDDWWEGDCARINGSDGTMFSPFIEKDTTLYAYIPEVCRSIWLNFKEEVEYEGIPGYRFEVPKEVFTSPYKYPDNMCFCMPVAEPLNKSCDFTGGGRMFSCKSGAPITLSKPHFLDADSYILEDVDGLDPYPHLHDTYIDVEPTTGFPLRANKRIQIGVEVQPLESLGAPWDTISHTLFPVMWADEEAALDKPLVDELKSKLINPLKYLEIGKWTAIGVGCLLTVVGVGYFTFLMTRD